LLVKVGPELYIDNLEHLWALVLWCIVSISIAGLIGWLGHRIFSLPYWTIMAVMLPNATAMPLLMLQALKTTGLLDELTFGDETVETALSRGQNFILLNSIIQQTTAFAIGPAVLKMDGRHDTSDGMNPRNDMSVQVTANNSINVDEHSRLLVGHHTSAADVMDDQVPLDKSHSQTVLGSTLSVFQTAAKKLNHWLNPPLYGAALAFVFGLIPPLHKAFLSRDGIFLPFHHPIHRKRWRSFHSNASFCAWCQTRIDIKVQTWEIVDSLCFDQSLRHYTNVVHLSHLVSG